MEAHTAPLVNVALIPLPAGLPQGQSTRGCNITKQTASFLKTMPAPKSMQNNIQVV